MCVYTVYLYNIELNLHTCLMNNIININNNDYTHRKMDETNVCVFFFIYEINDMHRISGFKYLPNVPPQTNICIMLSYMFTIHWTAILLGQKPMTRSNIGSCAYRNCALKNYLKKKNPGRIKKKKITKTNKIIIIINGCETISHTKNIMRSLFTPRSPPFRIV